MEVWIFLAKYASLSFITRNFKGKENGGYSNIFLFMVFYFYFYHSLYSIVHHSRHRRIYFSSHHPYNYLLLSLPIKGVIREQIEWGKFAREQGAGKGKNYKGAQKNVKRSRENNKK